MLSGTPIINGLFITELLEAMQQPREVAVVKCIAHRKDKNVVSLGNQYADEVAKH